MKLNDFFEKSPRPRSSPQKIITVANEKLEQELMEKVTSLTNELDRMHDVDKENVTLNARAQDAETFLKETLKREQELQNTNGRLQIAVTEGDVVRSDNQILKNDLNDMTNQLGVKESILEQSKKNNLELNMMAETLTIQVKELQVEDANTKVNLEHSVQQTVTSIDSLTKMATKLDETHKMFLATEVKYKEGQRKNSELNRKVNYLTSVSNTLQEERDALEQTRHMLKELASNVEADNVETKGAVRVTQSEMKKLRGTVGTMTMNIDGLVQENKELSSFNSALKNELSRPKYMSMAAIDRSEGFKLPTGGYRKHFLGNSKPTLLKFKREDNNDN